MKSQDTCSGLQILSCKTEVVTVVVKSEIPVKPLAKYLALSEQTDKDYLLLGGEKDSISKDSER